MPRRGRSYSRSVRSRPYSTRPNSDHHPDPPAPSESRSPAYNLPAMFPRMNLPGLPRTFPSLGTISNPCPYCPRLFLTERQLAEHLATHFGEPMDRHRLCRGMLENINLSLIRQRLAYLGRGLSLSLSTPAAPGNTFGVGPSGTQPGPTGRFLNGLGVLESPVNTGRPPIEYDFLGLRWGRIEEAVVPNESSSAETLSAPELRLLRAVTEDRDEGDSSAAKRPRKALDLSLRL